MKHKFLKKLTALLLGVIMVASMIPAIAITSSAAEGTYKLVTNASELEAGGKYLIVCSSKNKVMGAQSGTYRQGVDVTISDNTISTVPDGAQIVTLGGAVGAWTLGVSDTEYLYWDSSNSVKTGTTAHNWTIGIAEDGTAAVASSNDSTRNLRWNASSPRFACYTSAQTAIQLFKLTETSGGDDSGETTCEHLNKVAIGEPKTATCTEDGITAGEKCSDCGEVITAQETIPADGHTFVGGACSVCGTEEQIFDLVTDASTLKVGDKIIIVAKEYDFALSSTQATNNRPQLSIVKSDNSITFVEGIQIITLEAGTVDGTFAFNTGSGYLYAASSDKNHLKTEETLSDNSSWTVAIDADGVATIKAQGTNTRNWLRYNESNGIFSCYGSGQKDIAIYKLNESSDHDHVDANNDCVCDIDDCGYAYEHEFANSGEPTNPTCTEDGSQKQRCQCGAENTVVLPATGHTWNGTDCTVCDATRNLYTKVDDVTTLKEGDGIVIYHPTSGLLLSGTASGNKLAGVKGTVDGTTIGADFADELFLIVRKFSSYYCFETLDGKFLTTGATGNSLTLEDTITDYSKWYFDGSHIVSLNAKFKDKDQAIECYYGNFTVYGIFDDDAFKLELYKKDGYSNPNPRIQSFSLSLNKGVTINVIYNLPEAWLAANEGAKLVFTYGDTTEEYDNLVDLKPYSITLTPANIGKTVTVKLMVGETVVTSNDVSVGIYADKVTAAGAEKLGLNAEQFANLTALLAQIKTYGEAADKTLEGDITAPGFEEAKDADITGDLFKGASGVLGEYATVNLGVKTENVKDGYTLTVKLGDKTLVDGAAIADYITAQAQIVINGIYAADFNEDIVLTVSDENGEVASATLSFNTYLKALYNQTDDIATKNLIAAAYNYGVATEAYFSAQ